MRGRVRVEASEATRARQGEARENEAMRVEGERGDEASEARRDEPQPATAADADADADADASAIADASE